MDTLTIIAIVVGSVGVVWGVFVIVMHYSDRVLEWWMGI